MRIWNKCLSSSEIETLFTEEETPWLYQQIDGKAVPVKKVLRKVNGSWSEELNSKDDFDTGKVYVWKGMA